jgi:serine/threonine-protein kinase
MTVETQVRDPLIGRQVDGRYRIEALVARGGMATVYEATDLRLERTVALKIMHRTLAEDPGFVSRFVREARSAARLSHPNVVAVFDQGQDGDLVFLVMEYVPGRTVRDVLREHGRLTPSQALVVLEPVLEALGAAHRAGFVHRDVKPENVLIADDGRVKVADFGLARAIAASTSSAATQGVLIGTVAYLSPEQVERGVADARSDVYGAGILLFEMLTGTVPHAGETPLAIAYQHVNSDVPLPSQVVPDVPPQVDALVQTATRRDPDDRFRDAASFLAAAVAAGDTLPPPAPFRPRDTLVVVREGPDDDLADVFGPGAEAVAGAAAASSARRAAAAAAPQPSATPSSQAPTGPLPAPRRRRRWRRVLAVGLVLALLAGAGGAAWYLGSARFIPVPGVVGLSQKDATAKLASAELRLDVTGTAFSETVAAGTVISADPPGGSDVRKGSSVGVVLSKGPERYAVPSVAGQSLADATTLLTDNSLKVGAQRQVYDPKIAKGKVVTTDPKAGTRLKKNTPVVLVVSRGPKPVPVPDVAGTSVGKATDTLTKLGLKVTSTEKYSDSVDSGKVISTNPDPGTALLPGASVELVVSKGPPPVTVPNVVDAGRDAAIATLKAAGLKVSVEEPLGVTPLNRVLRQSPDGGSVVPKGTTVTIQIV